MLAHLTIGRVKLDLCAVCTDQLREELRAMLPHATGLSNSAALAEINRLDAASKLAAVCAVIFKCPSCSSQLNETPPPMSERS